MAKDGSDSDEKRGSGIHGRGRRGGAAAAPLAWALALLAGSATAVLACRRRPCARPGGGLPDRGAPGWLAPALLLPVVLATMHLAWGAGFLIGAPRDD